MNAPRRSLVACLVATASLAACGGTSPSTSVPTFDPDPPTSHAEVTPTSFVTAGAVAGDTKVSLSPLTYSDPASPCRGQAQTVTFGKLSTACSDAWIDLQPQHVPGEDVMQLATTPKSALLAATVDPATGTADATAFYETAALTRFAYQDNNRFLVQRLDTNAYTRFDLVFNEITQPGGHTTSVPDCNLPVSIRVTVVDSSVTGYLTSLSWPQPSTTAVVATYAPCAGISFAYQDGRTATKFGQRTAGSAVVTGHIENIAPFGNLWVTDGYAICGEPQLARVCGT